MPDVLLIQPPIRDFYLTAKRTFPYGLASLAAVLIREGFSVEILDALATHKSRRIPLPEEMAYLTRYYGIPDGSPFALFHHFRYFGYSLEFIGEKAKASGAFLVGISSLFTAYSDMALDTARIVKTKHPGCFVVLGGHHPTSLPEAVMACNAVDGAIRGEGEAALPALARALRDKTILSGVPGMVFRNPDGTLTQNDPAIVSDLDDLPLPATHLTDHRFYQRAHQGQAVIVASRGCPMTCTYCSAGSVGIPYRRRSVDSVLSEIERAVMVHEAGFIDFEDENLSLDRMWFLALLTGIEKRFSHKKIELRAMNGLYAPSLDETVICAMKTAGFRVLNLSLGTCSERQLKAFKRPNVVSSVEACAHLARKHGLETVCYIIIGAPDQSPDESLRDILYLGTLPAIVGVSVYYPSPGSSDYAKLATLKQLPEQTALMRSTALPLHGPASRDAVITLVRLGRILNFMKQLIGKGDTLPTPEPLKDTTRLDPTDRIKTGKRLLADFLDSGRILGVTPEGYVFTHHTEKKFCDKFLQGIENSTIIS